MAELQTNSNTKQDKRSLFTKIANGLSMGGLGLRDPQALAALNQRAAAEQAQMIQEQRMQELQMMVQQQILMQQQQMGQMSHSMGMQQPVQGQQTQVPNIPPESLSNPLMGALDSKGMQSQFGKDIDARRGLNVKVAEAPINAKSQAMAQGEKAGELSQRNFEAASAAADTNIDAFFDFGSAQIDRFGLKPGDFLGIADKLTPTQLNEYKAAFQGSSRESAAIVGRQLIPGVRGLSMTKVFEKSAAELGGTTESNIHNIARTMENTLSQAIAANIDEIDEYGNKVKIQDAMKDPITGKSLSELSAFDKRKVVNLIKAQFKEGLVEYYENRAFSKDPRLLSNERLEKIKLRSPRFDTIEELNASGVPAGTPVFVGGQWGVKE